MTPIRRDEDAGTSVCTAGQYEPDRVLGDRGDFGGEGFIRENEASEKVRLLLVDYSGVQAAVPGIGFFRNQSV